MYFCVFVKYVYFYVFYLYSRIWYRMSYPYRIRVYLTRIHLLCVFQVFIPYSYRIYSYGQILQNTPQIRHKYTYSPRAVSDTLSLAEYARIRQDTVPIHIFCPSPRVAASVCANTHHADTLKYAHIPISRPLSMGRSLTLEKRERSSSSRTSLLVVARPS